MASTKTLTLISLNIRGFRTKTTHIVELIHKSDFIFLQETHINNTHHAKRLTAQLGLRTSIFSLGTSTGVAILQTSDQWEITHENRDTEGQVAIAQIINTDNRHDAHTLVNSYAPATYTNLSFFFKQLETLLALRYKGQNIVLAGDFNCTLDTLDRKLQTHTAITRRHVINLHNIIAEHNLVDAYRTKFPTGIDYTFIDRTHHINPQASRIDKFYINEHYTITQLEHQEDTLKFTDHAAVLITINDAHSNNTHGRSPHWKFNNSLLQNTSFIDDITPLIQGYT